MSMVVTRSVRCHFSSPPQQGQRMLVTGSSTGSAVPRRGGPAVGPLPFQLSPAAGATHARPRQLARFGGGGRRGGRAALDAALEGSLSGFPDGSFGVGFAFALGKWRGRPGFVRPPRAPR